MKKIYLIAAGAILMILVIISILLSFRNKAIKDAQKNSPFPTSFIPQGSTYKQINDQDNQPPSGSSINTKSNSQTNNVSDTENVGSQNLTDTSVDISTIKPVETGDFKLQFSPQLNKIVVEKKTAQAEQKFAEWAGQNDLPQLVDNPDLVTVVNQGQGLLNSNSLIEFINILFNFNKNIVLPSPFPTINPSPFLPTPTNSNPKNPSTTPKPPSANYTYYAQCGDQGDLPLPDGCTLCKAGCGPTTVAMIASSFVSKDYDPKAIVDLYADNSYLLGCGGSYYFDAYELLNQLGLKTTSYLVFSAEKSDTVVPQLRNYLNAGWTFFTLANFCSGGCGHYFWITDIDDQGNIFAYDPAYGRYQIPYNENSRYPYPLYRLAFGVK